MEIGNKILNKIMKKKTIPGMRKEEQKHEEISDKNRRILTRASLGHGWNQLMVQPEMRPGNLRARDRNFSPTGEKQRTTWRFVLTLSRNQDMAFSGVGCIFEHSRFMMGRSSVMISPFKRHVGDLDPRTLFHLLVSCEEV